MDVNNGAHAGFFAGLERQDTPEQVMLRDACMGFGLCTTPRLGHCPLGALASTPGIAAESDAGFVFDDFI